MDWTTIVVLAALGGFLLWRARGSETKAETVQAGTKRLEQDNRLYQNIKAGMREVNWQDRDRVIRSYKHGELIFENAHMAAYHVDHFAESRTGFYFKDLGEYGLYGFFAGDGDEFFESYYRTDRTFQEEGRLLYDED